MSELQTDLYEIREYAHGFGHVLISIAIRTGEKTRKG